MKKKTLIEEMNDEIEREIALSMIRRKAGFFLMAKNAERKKINKDDILIEYLKDMFAVFLKLENNFSSLSNESIKMILDRDSIFLDVDKQ